MKHVLFLLALIAFTSLHAQVPTTEKKVIQVVGSAEMEIIPDEIYFKIVLKEYIENKVKVEISTLEDQLIKAVTQSGIDNKNLEIEKVYGQSWVRKRRKSDEIIESKTYLLKISDPGKIDLVLDKLDPKGIVNVYLDHYSHSKIEEYKKQMKIQAIKNAKEKATYLLEAIGEKLGGALRISEVGANTIGGFYMNQNEISNSSYKQYNEVEYSSFGKNEEPDFSIGFKTVQIRFEISVDFEIK